MSVILSHATLAPISTSFAANYKGCVDGRVHAKTSAHPTGTRSRRRRPRRSTSSCCSIRNGATTARTISSGGPVLKVTTPGSGVRNYPFDFQSASGSFTTSSEGVPLGTGCLALGQTSRRFFLHTTMPTTGRGSSCATRSTSRPRARRSSLPRRCRLEPDDLRLCSVSMRSDRRVEPRDRLVGRLGAGGVRERHPYLPVAIGRASTCNRSASTAARPGCRSRSRRREAAHTRVPSRPIVGRVHGYTAFNFSVAYGPFSGGVIAQFEHQ